jgi:subtilisin family serine protease
MTDWIAVFRGGNCAEGNAERLERFCKKIRTCLGRSHPKPNRGFRMAFAVVRATEEDLTYHLMAYASCVEYVEPDAEMQMIPELGSGVPPLSNRSTEGASTVASWGLDRIDSRALALDGAYDGPANGGENVHVYVLDTGIKTTHEDFASRAIPTLEVLGDGPVECNANDVLCAGDMQGHGTHCAGTIGGTAYGVAKGVTLHAVKILSDSGSGSFSWFIEALEWVVQNGKRPAVVSASLGAQVGMPSCIKPLRKPCMLA